MGSGVPARRAGPRAARTAAASRTSRNADTSSAPVPSELRGLVSDPEGTPLGNVHVTAWGTKQEAVTGADGVFRLRDLPGGTRTVELRAVGYTPTRRIVHISRDQPSTIELRMERTAVELPAVDVRVRAAEARLAEFERRRRLGVTGHFLTPEALAARPEAPPEQLLQSIPGLRVVRPPRGGPPEATMLVPPSELGPNGQRSCRPTLYVDGQRHAFTFQELNNSFRARDLLAVEIYPRPTSRPPEFVDFQNHCGAIVVWTKPPQRP